MYKADHQLTLNRNFMIEFTHVPSGKFVLFDGYLEDFSDDFKAQWSATSVYGRPDPIMTYKSTTREMTISWGILANDLAEAISNLAKIEVLMSMLYPHYTADKNATIEASPLIRVRFANMAIDVDVTSDEDNADSAFFQGQTIKIASDEGEEEREVIRPVLSKLNGTTGLLAAVKGFTYKPNLKEGVFMGHGTIFPKYVPMRCNMTILHTKPLGWVDSGLKNDVSTQFGTAGGNSAWRGAARWPYGVGGLAQRIPGVPNMQNKNIVSGIKQARFAAITGQVDAYDRDVLEDQDPTNDFAGDPNFKYGS